MDIVVTNKYCKGSARKIRPLLYLAKGKSASHAEVIYRFVKSYGSEIRQLIKSGIAVAIDKNLDPEKVYIKTIQCDKSKELKRHRFESKGRVTRIVKHMHHLKLTLTDTPNKSIKKVDDKVKDKLSKKLDK